MHLPICYRVKKHAARPRNTTNNTIILCFIYLSRSFLSNYNVSSSGYIERKYGSIMNLKGFGKKQPWPNIRHYPGIFLNLLRKTIKFSGRISSILAEIGTQGPDHVSSFDAWTALYTHCILLTTTQGMPGPSAYGSM